MVQIDLENVTINYPVYTTSRQRSILGFAANRASFGRVARDAGKIPIVTALQRVSLSLREGDRLALIGRNGSGKTTMLKLMSGLLLPDSGRVNIVGSRASLIASAGMDPDKSGVDNAIMTGKLLGLSKRERTELVEDVAAFTELGDFLDLPIRTYSAGMTVRLSFAIATAIVRDILIMDEIIGAGDALFIDKAAKRVRSMLDRARILVLATHSGGTAEQFCNKCIWLSNGRLLMSGPPSLVWRAYINSGGVALADVDHGSAAVA